jgi:hypothetical protein
MRFKGFTKRVLGTFVQSESFVAFDADHYKEAGVPFSSLAGMPVLEAFQLINKWNARKERQGRQEIVYYL